MAVQFKQKTGKTGTQPPTKGTRVYLSSTVKNFIVRAAACGDVPSEIVKKVKEECYVPLNPSFSGAVCLGIK